MKSCLQGRLLHSCQSVMLTSGKVADALDHSNRENQHGLLDDGKAEPYLLSCALQCVQASLLLTDHAFLT